MAVPLLLMEEFYGFVFGTKLLISLTSSYIKSAFVFWIFFPLTRPASSVILAFLVTNIIP